ncbi:hypothetical protein CYMTET_18361 [Cymbomonas tetramitiformis]|uniref:Uncharacterized protein n=1 Tax=Cymbomonas tetramitiformis TaxID=36881 RepID=A0AAE0G874_9CHLO|nr:hypothetical protein CYMTET_18361 [Cymbomonas tetramitiformis]
MVQSYDASPEAAGVTIKNNFTFFFALLTIVVALACTLYDIAMGSMFVHEVDCKDRQHQDIDALHSQGVGLLTVACIAGFVQCTFLIVAIVRHKQGDQFLKYLFLPSKNDSEQATDPSKDGEGSALLTVAEKEQNKISLLHLLYALLVTCMIVWPAVAFASSYMYPRASLDQLADDIYDYTEGINDHWVKCFDKVHKHISGGYQATSAIALAACCFTVVMQMLLYFGSTPHKVAALLSHELESLNFIRERIITSANSITRMHIALGITFFVMMFGYLGAVGTALVFQYEFKNEFNEGCDGARHAFQRQTEAGVGMLTAAMVCSLVCMALMAITAACGNDKLPGGTVTVIMLRVTQMILMVITAILTYVVCFGVWSFPFDTLREIMVDYEITTSSNRNLHKNDDHMFADEERRFQNWKTCLDTLDVFGAGKKYAIMAATVIITLCTVLYVFMQPGINVIKEVYENREANNNEMSELDRHPQQQQPSGRTTLNRRR